MADDLFIENLLRLRAQGGGVAYTPGSVWLVQPDKAYKEAETEAALTTEAQKVTIKSDVGPLPVSEAVVQQYGGPEKFIQTVQGYNVQQEAQRYIAMGVEAAQDETKSDIIFTEEERAEEQSKVNRVEDIYRRAPPEQQLAARVATFVSPRSAELATSALFGSMAERLGMRVKPPERIIAEYSYSISKEQPFTLRFMGARALESRESIPGIIAIGMGTGHITGMAIHEGASLLAKGAIAGIKAGGAAATLGEMAIEIGPGISKGLVLGSTALLGVSTYRTWEASAEAYKAGAGFEVAGGNILKYAVGVAAFGHGFRVGYYEGWPTTEKFGKGELHIEKFVRKDVLEGNRYGTEYRPTDELVRSFDYSSQYKYIQEPGGWHSTASFTLQGERFTTIPGSSSSKGFFIADSLLPTYTRFGNPLSANPFALGLGGAPKFVWSGTGERILYGFGADYGATYSFQITGGTGRLEFASLKGMRSQLTSGTLDTRYSYISPERELHVKLEPESIVPAGAERTLAYTGYYIKVEGVRVPIMTSYPVANVQGLTTSFDTSGSGLFIRTTQPGQTLPRSNKYMGSIPIPQPLVSSESVAGSSLFSAGLGSALFSASKSAPSSSVSSSSSRSLFSLSTSASRSIYGPSASLSLSKSSRSASASSALSSLSLSTSALSGSSSITSISSSISKPSRGPPGIPGLSLMLPEESKSLKISKFRPFSRKKRYTASLVGKELGFSSVKMPKISTGGGIRGLIGKRRRKK